MDLLSLSDDGHVVVDARGKVVALDAQAAAMLGLDAEAAPGRDAAALGDRAEGWSILAEALREGRPADATLRLGGRRVLAALRGPAGGPRLLELRDLDALDWRRGAGSRALATARTRPDFEAQRRLSPELHRVLARGERAMEAGARVLIAGESGTGKSEIARFLHGRVADGHDPFVVVNAALGGALVAERLFGAHGHAGAIAEAAGGTLFLDDLAELPAEAQARLVGYLEDGEGRGGTVPAPTGLRVIAATNADLRRAVAEGRFRADLYWRLAVVTLRVPPLREMPGLVGHLTDRFLATLNQRRAAPVILPARLRELLDDHAFPGNVRELLNVVQRAAILMEDAADLEELMAELIVPAMGPEGERPPTMDLRTEVRRFERALIDRAVQAHGSKRKAAKALGVDIGTIVRKTAPRAETAGTTGDSPETGTSRGVLS